MSHLNDFVNRMRHYKKIIKKLFKKNWNFKSVILKSHGSQEEQQLK